MSRRFINSLGAQARTGVSDEVLSPIRLQHARVRGQIPPKERRADLAAPSVRGNSARSAKTVAHDHRDTAGQHALWRGHRNRQLEDFGVVLRGSRLYGQLLL